jgi:hypothetical protein
MSQALDKDLSLEERLIIYMIELSDEFSKGTSIKGLNSLIDKNHAFINEINETRELNFTPRFPFKTREQILNELLDNQKPLTDALRYEESLLPKNTRK